MQLNLLQCLPQVMAIFQIKANNARQLSLGLGRPRGKATSNKRNLHSCNNNDHCHSRPWHRHNSTATLMNTLTLTQASTMHPIHNKTTNSLQGIHTSTQLSRA